MLQPLSSVPDRITAGTTVKIRRTYADFPSDQAWTSELKLAGKSLLSVPGTPSGGGFDYVLTAAATAPLAAGNYTWRILVTKAPETYVAESGVVEVLGNIAAAEAGDFQSWEERTLPIVELAIAGRLPSGAESYQIAGRAITKMKLAELLDLRVRLRATIRAQKHPGSLGPRVLATFTGVESESGTPSVPPLTGP